MIVRITWHYTRPLETQSYNPFFSPTFRPTLFPKVDEIFTLFKQEMHPDNE